MFQKLSIIAIGLLVISSCVSKKKWIEANTKIANLETREADCEKHAALLTDSLTKVLEDFKAFTIMADKDRIALLAQLDQKSAALSEKDEALRSRANRLRELQSRIDNQSMLVQNLRKSVTDALVNFNSDELTVSMKEGQVQVTLSDDLLFESASSKIDPKGKKAIGKLAVVLKNDPSIRITIVGHTDSIPIKTTRYKDNWDLSVDRAASIVRVLTEEYGIPGDRIQATGKSSYFPLEDNKTKEGRAKNIRTEILLTPKLDELLKLLESDGSTEPSEL